MTSRFISARCPNCQTEFDSLPVAYDEDGGYAALEVTQCSDPRCEKLLCACCDQFHCDGCGDTFCAAHLVSIADGTETPLHCCRECAADPEQQEELELASCCPECRSENVSIIAFDFGVDAQTGYQDSGEGFRCLDCGAKGETADLTVPVKPERRPITSEVARVDVVTKTA